MPLANRQPSVIRDRALDFNPNDRTSRLRWSNATAAIMCQLPMPAIHAIVAAGESEFVRVARLELAGHAFKTEDFKHIFAILRRTSAANRKLHPSLILASR